jgi:hypothetical protein
LNFEAAVFQHTDLMAENLLILFILFFHCFNLLFGKSINFSFSFGCLFSAFALLEFIANYLVVLI